MQNIIELPLHEYTILEKKSTVYWCCPMCSLNVTLKAVWESTCASFSLTETGLCFFQRLIGPMPQTGAPLHACRLGCARPNAWWELSKERTQDRSPYSCIQCSQVTQCKLYYERLNCGSTWSSLKHSMIIHDHVLAYHASWTACPWNAFSYRCKTRDGGKMSLRRKSKINTLQGDMILLPLCIWRSQACHGKSFPECLDCLHAWFASSSSDQLCLSNKPCW